MRDWLMIIIPFAGGSAYAFSDLAKKLNEKNVIILELPGRGKRHGEDLLTNIDDAVNDLYDKIKDTLPRYNRYFIYGHSLGSLLGYLLTKKLIADNKPAPAHLFVSGRGGPVCENESKGRYLLPSAAFWEMIDNLGGCPKEILQSPELKELFEPILKADFQTLDSYHHQATDAVLPVKITGFFGSEEKTSFDDMQQWQRESAYDIEIIECPGNHFFIVDHWEMISRKMKAVIGV